MIPLIPIKGTTDFDIELKLFLNSTSFILQSLAVLFTHVKHDKPRTFIVALLYAVFLGSSAHVFSHRERIDPLETTVTIQPFVLTTPVMNYENDWIAPLVEDLKKPIDFSKCPVCNFTPVKARSPSDSTDRDALIVTAFGSEFTGVDLFVRTFRTSGSKARLIMFTNHDLMPKEMYQLLTDCGVNIVDVPVFKKAPPLQRRKSRFPLIFDLVNTIPEHFNRIMYLDLFDSLFQGDPFIAEINPNQLYATIERSYIKYLWSWRRVRNLPGYDYSVDYEKKIPNSGWFVASPKIVKICVEMVVAMYGPHLKKIRSNDQILFDWLIFSGNYERAGLTTNMTESHYSLWTAIAKDTFGYYSEKLGNFTHKVTDVNPLLFHQYDRNVWMTKAVRNQCPNNNYKINIERFLSKLL